MASSRLIDRDCRAVQVLNASARLAVVEHVLDVIQPDDGILRAPVRQFGILPGGADGVLEELVQPQGTAGVMF